MQLTMLRIAADHPKTLARLMVIKLLKRLLVRPVHPTRPPWIRVTNSFDREARVYVEPWGFDFPVAPESWLEFEADGASVDLGFEVSFDGDDNHHESAVSLSVHHTGSCHAIVVVFPDGKRERFSWSIER